MASAVSDLHDLCSWDRRKQDNRTGNFRQAHSALKLQTPAGKTNGRVMTPLDIGVTGESPLYEIMQEAKCME